MPLAVRYAILGRLAETDGGSLSRARRRDGGATVLLEVLDPARGEPYRLDRLRQAQDVAAALPAAAPVLRPLELGTWAGRPALVLEDFDGVPLADLLGAPLAPGAFLPLAVAFAGALADLHHEGLVHRALRPECILGRPGG